ncbi:DUF3846 domain-containing protein [Staphylococcus equorum]|uniref:DUF3846 domain-containing protein n=1 Tax=Staphylococcus equorum TaxID=246432 RepID=UPI0018686A28|nr:DUF3846 domain-containing protein [Staphylococcus equorum]
MRIFYVYDNKKKELKEMNAHESVNEMNVFYQIIGCDLVEMPYLNHGISIVCDEEGLLKKPSDINQIRDLSTGNTLDITGKLIFISTNDEGETVGLNQEQIGYLKEEIEITTLQVNM